jgi:hypothetical protein
MNLDVLPVLARFEAHGKRYEIRQLVTGGLVSRDLASDEFTPWPVGFTVDAIYDEVANGRSGGLRKG